MSTSKYKIERGYTPKKITKPNPLYEHDKVMLVELDIAMNSNVEAHRFTEASKIISRHMPKLDKASDDFMSIRRRIVRQFDKKK